uniref:Desulfoferrodoxin n=1 Tax=candidate division CPR3 bacterium TaxID=2268181 RepID=A0A7C4M2S7_UNCC3
MTKLNEVYKCNICGNMVEMMHTGVGQLVCCGQPMELLTEKAQDEGLEKHVPVIDFENNKIMVGSIPHPMEEAHYIEWIEIIYREESVCRKFLKPGMNPEIDFELKNLDPKELVVREHCNIHGLWKA